MRVALYIQDGLEQIVLTPESEFERSVLAKIETPSRTFAVKKGSFYHCQGGWARQGADDSSTIIVLRAVERVEADRP